jgi:uncharacterized integral membrane protein
MIDWKCQLKLSVLVGIIAALITHTAMDHLIQISFDWWFNLAVFAATTAGFMLGMRLGFIRCSACRRNYCDQCPANRIS